MPLICTVGSASAVTVAGGTTGAATAPAKLRGAVTSATTNPTAATTDTARRHDMTERPAAFMTPRRSPVNTLLATIRHYSDGAGVVHKGAKGWKSGDRPPCWTSPG